MSRTRQRLRHVRRRKQVDVPLMPPAAKRSPRYIRPEIGSGPSGHRKPAGHSRGDVSLVSMISNEVNKVDSVNSSGAVPPNRISEAVPSNS